MADDGIPSDVEKWIEVGEQWATGFLKVWSAQGLEKVGVSILSEAAGAIWALLLKVLVPTATLAGKGLVALEEPMMPVLAAFVVPIVANLFGTEADISMFTSHGNRAGRGQAAGAIVNAVMRAIAGDASGPATPSEAGAKRIAGASVHASLEGWFNGVITEMLGDCLPFDLAHFEQLASLGEDVTRALGLGRLVRRALSPLVDATAATPMKWATEKIYRTQLLSASSVARQWARGRWDWPDVVEELARQGYTDERIDALINEQRKFFGPTDVREFVIRNYWTLDQGLKHLRDQGYDEQGAQDSLRLEGLRRIGALEEQEASAIIGAFVTGDIDRGTLVALLETAVKEDIERALLTELADVRRAVNVQPLTPGEAHAAVKAKVLAVSDYREVLRRVGRTEDAILVLELMLRAELDKDAKMEDLRAQAEAERAAEKQAREAEAAKRRAAIDAERALHRRGALGDLERAVVRGLIPIARYQEVLDAQYDPDTVGILVDLVEQARQAYLDEQKRREEALKNAGRRSIDVGQLEQAVLAGVLTIDQFRQQLDVLKFSAADADVLTATLAATKKDRDDARAKRAAAEEAAKRKGIDLGRFERLVRRGARSLADYDQLLASLGFDDASRAAMAELLQLEMADDAAAKKARADAAAKSADKGLSLEQFRRAVLLGFATLDDFEHYLIAQHFTADAQAILIAELRADVAAADAARTRRAQPEPAPDARELPVATVARAARLGLIAIATYQARLERAGYSADDVALELDLLTAEIADVQAARAQQTAADKAVPEKGITLEQLAGAVRKGLQHLEDYRARAVELGLRADAVNTLVRVLGDELLAVESAKARRPVVDAALAAQSLSLSELEDQVRSGTLSIQAFRETLESRGIPPVDAELLVAALLDDLGS